VPDLVRPQAGRIRAKRGLIQNLRFLSAGRGTAKANLRRSDRSWRSRREPRVTVPLDDLARARIGDAPRPELQSARGSMHPVDHVVADVHRVGAVGQHIDLESVSKSRGFECLVPPVSRLRAAPSLRPPGAPESTQYWIGFTGSLTAALGSFFSSRCRRRIALHHRFADRHACNRRNSARRIPRRGSSYRGL